MSDGIFLVSIIASFIGCLLALWAWSQFNED